MKTKNTKWNAPMIIFYVFFVFIFILYLQYLYLSLSSNVYGINMKEFADNRNVYSATLTAKRGTIYDNSGNALAIDISSYTVIAYLDESRTGSSKTLYHVKDKETTAKSLAPLLNMSEEAILKLLNQDLYQVELGPGGRGITEVLKKKIEALNLPGIDFIESYKRYYPNGDFASYAIGYAKMNEVENNKELVGELGIEVAYNDILKGTNGYIKYQQDRYGYKIPDTKEEYVEAIDGSDIYLTIDSNIQRILEAAVKETSKNSNPEWITINVMDAKTGDILGSASTPSFDPNLLNLTNYENPLTSFTYEPGSVMKIFTYMCAMEKGTYKGDETYLSGHIDIEGTTVYDWKKEGWGNITYDMGFELSSNVGVSYITQKFIDKNDLKSCLTSYGFGSKTGIELPRELTGSINFNYPVEIAAASYGQGISTTAIQQLQALTIIANDGYMLKPHIVSKIVNNNEIIYEREITSQRLVSSETVNYIKELMYNTVNDVSNNATGIAYRVSGLDVIGKTGTAEIFDEETGKYLVGSNIHSFAGMFPKENPEIIIFVSVKKPNNGSSSIKSLTQPVIESIAKYKGLIKGNVSNEKNIYTLDNYINKKVSDIKNNDSNFIILGDGDKVIDQYPKSGTSLLSKDKVFILTNNYNNVLPSLIDYSRIEAISLLNLLNIPYEITGYGRVTSIIEGDPLKIILSEKEL